MPTPAPAPKRVGKTEIWIHLGLWLVGFPLLYAIANALNLLGSLLILFISFMAADVDPEQNSQFILSTLFLLFLLASSGIATGGNI